MGEEGGEKQEVSRECCVCERVSVEEWRVEGGGHRERTKAGPTATIPQSQFSGEDLSFLFSARFF